MEGHILLPEGDASNLRPELSIAVDRLFENSLNLRMEGFYHGAGVTDPEDYFAAAQDSSRTSPYLGRLYAALGASYELTPLLLADTLLLANLSDGSLLTSLYMVYSLSDESELALVGSLPIGEETQFLDIASEFGLYPASLSMEARLTF